MANNVSMIFHFFLIDDKDKTSKIIDSTEKINWIPVLQCGKDYKNMGFTQEGTWVLEEVNGINLLSDNRSFMKAVVLLEHPWYKVRNEIDDFFSHIDEYSIDIDSFFPMVDLIRAGLEFRSEYWANSAFIWYEELSKEKKLLLKSTLITISSKKWTTQKLRHKIKRELNKL